MLQLSKSRAKSTSEVGRAGAADDSGRAGGAGPARPGPAGLPLPGRPALGADAGRPRACRRGAAVGWPPDRPDPHRRRLGGAAAVRLAGRHGGVRDARLRLLVRLDLARRSGRDLVRPGHHDAADDRHADRLVASGAGRPPGRGGRDAVLVPAGTDAFVRRWRRVELVHFLRSADQVSADELATWSREVGDLAASIDNDAELDEVLHGPSRRPARRGIRAAPPSRSSQPST